MTPTQRTIHSRNDTDCRRAQLLLKVLTAGARTAVFPPQKTADKCLGPFLSSPEKSRLSDSKIMRSWSSGVKSLFPCLPCAGTCYSSLSRASARVVPAYIFCADSARRGWNHQEFEVRNNQAVRTSRGPTGLPRDFISTCCVTEGTPFLLPDYFFICKTNLIVNVYCKFMLEARRY